MGGFGSGFFRDKKETVERCLCLDINDLVRKGLLKGKYARKKMSWICPETQEELHRVEIEIMPNGNGLKTLSITHFDSEKRVTVVYDQHLYLESMKLVSGGKRWWFQCSGVSGMNRSKKCQKRVGKLYLPPDKRDFACRECHELTYESCQTGKFTPLTTL